MRHKCKCFYFLLCGCLVACSSIAAEFNLDDKLAELADNSDTTLQKKERQLLNLLDQYEKPKQKGKIYAGLVCLCFKNLDRKPHYKHELIHYAEKAVKYPLDNLKAVEVYQFWGQVLRFEETKSEHSDMPDLKKSKAKTKNKAKNETKPNKGVWSKSSAPFIKALDLVFQSLKNKPEWPVTERMCRVNVPKSDPQYEELMEKQKKLVTRWKKAKKVTQPLISKRKVLKRMIARRYLGRDDPLSNLRSDIHAVIDDKERTQKIYKLVKDELERLKNE